MELQPIPLSSTRRGDVEDASGNEPSRNSISNPLMERFAEEFEARHGVKNGSSAMINNPICPSNNL